MVALQLERPASDFLLFIPCGAGWILEFHILVDHLSVEDNALEASVLDLLARGVEPRARNLISSDCHSPAGPPLMHV